MRPPKHSPLFMAIALALAIMLFISYPIPVYAIPVAPIIAILCSTLGGFILGWVLNDMTQHESRSPGVTLDSYVSEIASAFEHDTQMLSSYGYTVLASLERMRLYYARLAEHRVLDYLDKDTEYLDQYKAEIMIDVADDLCNVTNAYFQSLDNILDHLNWLSYDRFTGDLQYYKILLSDNEEFNVGAGADTYDVDYLDKFWVSVKAQSDVIVYDCKAKVLANASHGSTFDPRYKLVLAGDVDVAIEARIGSSGDHVYGYRYVGFLYKNPETQESRWIWKVDLGEDLSKWHCLEVFGYIDSIYDTAWAYAKAYHQMLRGMGYTDKTQVPDNLLVVPPDVVFPTPWNLEQNYSMTPEEVMAYYIGLLNSLQKFFNESNYRLAQYLSHLNVTMPDVREWLKNVVIRFPNGTIWMNVTRLIPIWYPGVQTFYPGMDNVLQNPMGALVQLPNGEWQYVQIPSGYMLNPMAVHTPFGETTQPWTLQPYQSGFNPVYQNYQPPEPEYVKTMHEVMQLIMAFMPLLLILAIMQMIVNLGKRR